jgi:hypothetical protein
MGNEPQTDKAQVTRWVWLSYQGLAWFYLLAIIILTSIGLFRAIRDYVNVYKYLPYIHYCFSFVFVVACIGAITRRRWSAHWVRVTGVWCLAASWPTVMSLTVEAIERLWGYGSVVVIGGPNTVTERYAPCIFSVAGILDVIFLLTFVFTANIIWTRRTKTDVKEVETQSFKHAHLVYVALSVIFFGLLFRWVDSHIEHQTYGMTIGSYLVAAGVVLILVWHLLVPEFFLAASAPTMSVILLVTQAHIYSSGLTFVLWLPLIALGLRSLLRKRLSFKLRVLSFGVPVLFAMAAVCGPIMQLPLYMNFRIYHKVTSQRPADFPGYLQAPVSATDVRYQGGDRPYLSFTVEDPHPAAKTLDFISSNLEQASWKRLGHDLLNPQVESSHLTGWYNPLTRWFGSGDDSKETARRKRRFRWNADWINNKNETVNVFLQYAPPETGEKKPTTLYCNLSQSPPSPLNLQFIKRYRQIHENNSE